jgi:predicted GTPase
MQHLQPQPEWSEHDKAVWRTCLEHIGEAQLATLSWDEIPRAMLDQLTYVARVYHGGEKDAEYAFSIPELLLMLETWSREYRAEVIEHMPLAHNLKISTLRTLSRNTGTAVKLYGHVSPLIRAIKIGVNPVTGVASEISSMLGNRYISELGQHMQANMKVVLFEQVTQVGIDLYSGRLKFSEEELAARRRAEQEPRAEEIKPLSIIVLGQVNAGKSSLVNALKQQCVAGVDPLPATSGFHYYAMTLANELDVHLIDSPGLDGGEATSKLLLREAVKADLLLWVSQANQPAKALDHQFLVLWNDYFADHLARKKPPIVLVTTHNDRLPPTGSWNPPYDLEDSSNKKACSMMAALRYSHEAIGLSAQSMAVPVALPPGSGAWNLDVLEQLMQRASSEARSAQLNRQRLDSDSSAAIMKKALQQTAGLVKVGVRLATRKSQAGAGDD